VSDVSGNCNLCTRASAGPSGRSQRSVKNKRLTDRQASTAVPLPLESREWQAFEEMSLASRAQFTGLAYGILQNKEDAEDAVQDALVSAYVHLRRFEGRSAIKTWFTRVVPERVLDDPASASLRLSSLLSKRLAPLTPRDGPDSGVET